MNVVFRASRWNRNIRQSIQSIGQSVVGGSVGSRAVAKTCGIDDGEGDYLNCPMTADEYRRVLRGAHERGIGDGARFRQGEVFRRVPADRSDGAPRRRHAAVRADEAGGAEGSANRAAAVRRRAAAAGQPRRRSLQPRRVPDAVEVGRAGEGAADDSGARAGRVRAVRHGPSQHLHQRADRAARDVADARQPVAVFRRADFRRRGLRRVGGIGPDCRPQRRGARARGSPARAAAHDGHRRARVLRVARQSARLSADEHHLRHHGAAARAHPRQAEAQARHLGTRAGGLDESGAEREAQSESRTNSAVAALRQARNLPSA